MPPVTQKPAWNAGSAAREGQHLALGAHLPHLAQSPSYSTHNVPAYSPLLGTGLL